MSHGRITVSSEFSVDADLIIRFNMLGPLEFWSGRQQIPLGGPKQRAILGYLLVHANEVVPTRKIIGALWPEGAPSTARKMLQNTVSNIRGLLSVQGDSSPSALLTHSPGYMLRTDVASLDLLHFQHLSRVGQTALADGAWEVAARSLREALDLWRGEPLADLRDTGVGWAQLDVLRESRFSILEDYFEAELAAGHHREHVAELEQLVIDEPHRERAAHQLMLALYRCGRQVDALAVYHRTRAVLQDTLGLEPTRTLRNLERAILVHDTRLESPAFGAQSQSEISAPRSIRPVLVGPSVIALPRMERNPVSVLTIALAGPDNVAAEEVDTLFAEAGSDVRREVDAAGGTVLFCTGSMVQAVFGALNSHQQDALAAARVAVGLRNRFARSGEAVQLRLSIRTEDMLIRSDCGQIDVVSPTLEQCMRVVRTLPPNEVWVCDVTRRCGGIDVADTVFRGLPAVSWSRVSPCMDNDPTPVFVERSHELSMLERHFEHTIQTRRGRLVTVLGEEGIGKTRLISEWSSRLNALPAPPLVLRRTVPQGAPWAARSMVSELIACLMDVNVDELDRRMPADVEQLLSMIDRQGPTVLIVEDLHRADEATQEFVGKLAAQIGSRPILLVATARFPAPDLGRWDLRAFTTMTLDRISDAAIESLWTALLAGDVHGGELTPQLKNEIDGNPLFAIEFARHHMEKHRSRLDSARGNGVSGNRGGGEAPDVDGEGSGLNLNAS